MQHEGARPTIRDVAQHAGVSKSLVSLVFQGSDLVTDDKRKRVLTAAKALGYHPNLAARSLKSDPSRSRVIGLVVSDLSQPWVSDVIAGVRPVLEEAGYQMLLSLLSQPTAGEPMDLTSLAVFRDLGVAGIIAVGTLPEVERMRALVLPDALVFAGWSDPDRSFDAVRSDDERGLSLLVNHLVERGHTRIAHAGGAGGEVGSDRESGYRKAMQLHGLADRIRTAASDFSIGGGYRAARTLLDAPEGDRPTAITCLNDLAAMGARQAATELGLSVALTGYDDIEMAGLDAHSLTTIDPDSRAVGAAAASTILARLRDGRTSPSLGLIRPRLVVRNSSDLPS